MTDFLGNSLAFCYVLTTLIPSDLLSKEAQQELTGKQYPQTSQDSKKASPEKNPSMVKNAPLENGFNLLNLNSHKAYPIF